jgi:hypothetical protein
LRLKDIESRCSCDFLTVLIQPLSAYFLWRIWLGSCDLVAWREIKELHINDRMSSSAKYISIAATISVSLESVIVLGWHLRYHAKVTLISILVDSGHDLIFQGRYSWCGRYSGGLMLLKAPIMMYSAVSPRWEILHELSWAVQAVLTELVLNLLVLKNLSDSFWSLGGLVIIDLLDWLALWDHASLSS